jgi:hypothetical protein
MKRPTSVNDLSNVLEYIEHLEQIKLDHESFMQVLSVRLATKIASEGEAIYLPFAEDPANLFIHAEKNGNLHTSIVTNEKGTFLTCVGIIPAYFDKNNILIQKQMLNIATDKELFVTEYVKYIESLKEKK